MWPQAAVSPISPVTEQRDSKGKWVAGAGVGGVAGYLAARKVASRVAQAYVVHKERQAEPVIARVAPMVARREAERLVAHLDRARGALEANINSGFTVPAEQDYGSGKLSPVTLRVRRLRRLIRDGVEPPKPKPVPTITIPAKPLELLPGEDLGDLIASFEEKFEFDPGFRRTFTPEEMLFGVKRTQPRKAPKKPEMAPKEELEHLLDAAPDKRIRRKESLATRKTDAWVSRGGKKGRVIAADKAVHANVGLTWLRRKHTARQRSKDISASEMSDIRQRLRVDADKVAERAKVRARTVFPKKIEQRIADHLRFRYSFENRGAWRALARRRTLLAGAALGALAGVGAVGAHDKLKKAAPNDDPESAMADRLAHVFRSWKDDATADLLHGRPGALDSTILTGLDHALRPLDGALRGGIGAPIQVGDSPDGSPNQIAFTFMARAPSVEAYIDRYRADRIQGLADTQRQAIKEILIRGAQRGDGPEDLARAIRSQIGLTPLQAQAVDNYRQELKAGSAAALERQLRDKRFDRTVQRAISEKAPLTDRQIDKMVDAYHRKALALRAMTIARTEAVGAANNGHIAAVSAILDKFPGYTIAKTWMATDDDRTRHDHRELHGKTVIGLETPFICDNGDEVRWPHDPQGKARQVVNCRCTLACRLIPRSLAAQRGPASVPMIKPLTPESLDA